MKSASALRRALPLLPILLIFLAANAARDPGAGPHGDEPEYLAFAHNLTHGYYADRHSHAAGAYLWHGPGLPLLLVPFVKAGASLSLDRLTGPAFLFGAAILLFCWMRLYVSRRGALLAAYAFALYIPVYDAVGVVGSDALAVLVLVAVAYTTTLFIRTGRRVYGVLAGVALGYLVMTRVEYGWVVEAAVVAAAIWWAARRGPLQRRLLFVCALALALCIPWLAYTYDVSGRVNYWGNAGGMSLYWMGAAQKSELGDWHSAVEVRTDPRFAGHRPFFARVQKLPPLEQDSEFLHAAVEGIKARPGRYVKDVAANVSRLVFNTPYSYKQEPLSTALYAVPAGALLTLLAISMVALWRLRRAIPVELLPLAVLSLAAFAIHVPVAANPRFSLPVVPLAICFVSVVLLRNVGFRGTPARETVGFVRV